MFGIHVITDIIKIPASDLIYQTCRTSKQTDAPWLSMLPILHREIDKIYPNRVLINVGLLISRYYRSQRQSLTEETEVPLQEESYPPPQKKRRTVDSTRPNRAPTSRTSDPTTQFMQSGGVCDGSSVHYTVTFPMIVFRPYVGEVLVGSILDADASGIIVSLGFMASIFVPANYMLQPSAFVMSSHTKGGVWVWTPTYEDEDDENHSQNDEPLRYEMNLGAEIRIRVKSIHYPSVTSTAKGAPMIGGGMSHSNSFDAASSSTNQNATLHRKDAAIQAAPRQRSNSVGAYNDTTKSLVSPSQPNTAMYIIASICEDGLGLTSWWANEEEEEEDPEEQAE